MVAMQLKPKQPEKYNGSRDFQKIDNWVASMDSYFAITEAQTPLVYHYLNTVFTDEAATWFRYTYGKEDPTTVTWEQVRAALLLYFVRPNHTRRLRDQWADARQIGTVLEYHTYLAQLAMQLGNIDEGEFLDRFIRGLKSNTRTELEFRDPPTITDAVKWADTYDARFYRRKDNKRYYGPLSTQQEDNRGEPMQLDVLQTTSNDPTPIQIDAFRTKYSTSSNLIKLTEEERNQLRDIGACFRCRKQGHMARDCPSKGKSSSGNADRQ